MQTKSKGWGDPLIFAPVVMIIVLTGPLLAGLAGVLLPAIGYFPSLGGNQFTPEFLREVTHKPVFGTPYICRSGLDWRRPLFRWRLLRAFSHLLGVRRSSNVSRASFRRSCLCRTPRLHLDLLFSLLHLAGWCDFCRLGQQALTIHRIADHQ